MLRHLLALSAAALFTAAAPAKPAPDKGHYLFVWTGDQAKQANNFLIVIDADPASPTYGRMVSGVETDLKSVRIHHTEYEMPASGMLFANDHDSSRTVILDLKNPLAPRVSSEFRSMGGFSMPHSFQRLPNGNVLASFQFTDHGGDHADHKAMAGKSGGIVEIDDHGKVIRSASNADPAFADEGLLPYSLAILPAIDRVIVTNSPMGDDYLLTSNTYQLFRLSDLKLLGTWRLDPGTDRNGHIAPEEARIGPDGAAYIQTLSCGIQRVTGMNTPAPTATLVHKFPGDFCGVPTIVSHYLVQSVPAIRGFAVIDIADPAKVREVSRLTISDKFDPHWTAWDARTKRIVAPPARPGERLYLLKLDEKAGALSIDESFRDSDGKVGFSFDARAWPHGWTGAAQPHGAVFSR